MVNTSISSDNTTPPQHRSWWARWQRRVAHRWYVLCTPALLKSGLQATLDAQIAASETRHTGQIAVYVERELPAHYIMADRNSRERAVGLFGKLGVWDTEHNNGVLVYLLEAEHAIEVVADRGVLQHMSEADWAAMAQRLAALLQEGQVSQGLQQAVDEVDAVLMAHFPRQGTSPDWGNEVPNLPKKPFAL